MNEYIFYYYRYDSSVPEVISSSELNEYEELESQSFYCSLGNLTPKEAEDLKKKAKRFAEDNGFVLKEPNEEQYRFGNQYFPTRGIDIREKNSYKDQEKIEGKCREFQRSLRHPNDKFSADDPCSLLGKVRSLAGEIRSRRIHEQKDIKRLERILGTMVHVLALFDEITEEEAVERLKADQHIKPLIPRIKIARLHDIEKYTDFETLDKLKVPKTRPETTAMVDMLKAAVLVFQVYSLKKSKSAKDLKKAFGMTAYRGVCKLKSVLGFSE